MMHQELDGFLPRCDPSDTLAVRFLTEGEQDAREVAEELAAFIAAARTTLELAIYDCRLDGAVVEPIRSALHDRMRAGVSIRLLYDAGDDKPQGGRDLDRRGGDPAERDTHERVRELGLPDRLIRSIRGQGLMHHKYIVRDGEDVWTGSMNWSHDSMERMENVVFTLHSRELVAHFSRDFDQLYLTETIGTSGAFPTGSSNLRYCSEATPVDVDFSPGQGEHINEWVAKRVGRARDRVVICSMLFTSSKLLNAFMELLDRGDVEIWGVYDRTQMESVLDQWRGQPQLAWKVQAVERLLTESRLIGKRSLPYRPGERHNFMHNKTLVVDNGVISGSYNLSHNAQTNAENMLSLANATLAESVVSYVDRFASRLSQTQAMERSR